MKPVQRMIESIAQILAAPGVAADMAKLAAEYAEAHRAANRRLEQCSTLLDGGRDYEALQAAETPPVLLDLVATLSFDRSDEWRTLCGSRNLPVAEELNARAISQLNDLYAKGITTAHPLYRDYRRAIAERDDTRALAVLRTIVRLNPSDTNARSEIARLDKKCQALLLVRLGETVARGDRDATLEALEQLEEQGAGVLPSHPAVEQAQAIRHERDREAALDRCRSLTVWLDRLKEREAWTEALAPLREIELLFARFQITLDADTAAQFAAARDWARGQERQYETEQRFQAALRDILFAVAQAETQPARTGASALKQWRAERHDLSNRWRELESFSKPVPEEAQLRVRRRLQTTQAEIARLTRQKRMGITVALAAVLAVMIGTFLWLWQQRATQSQLAELARLESQRQVGAAEKFIESLRRTEPKAVSRPRLVAALTKTEQWIAEEHRRVSATQEVLARLAQYAQAQFTNASIEVIAGEWRQAQQAEQALAAEFRPGVEAPLLEFANRFEAFTAVGQRQRQQEFASAMADAEKAAAQFDQRDASLRGVRVAVADLRGVVTKLEMLTNAPSPQLALPDSLAARIAPLRTKLDQYQADLVALETAQAGMRGARTLTNYLTALARFDAERLRSLPEVRAARTLSHNADSLTDMQRILLLPDDPEGWQHLAKNPVPGGLPATVMPAELSKWLSLRDDDNLREIHRYEMPDMGKGLPFCSPPVRAPFIYSRGPIQQYQVTQDSLGGRMRFAAVVFVPGPGLERPEFATNQPYACQCPEGQPGELARLGGLTPESTLLRTVRLADLIDATGEKFQRSVLALLDEIRSAEGVNPLFKAYVHWKLLELIAVRPQAWGASWTPSLREDQQTLQDWGAADWRSGDWMLPAKIGARDRKLTDFYARTGKRSYQKQALFFAVLLHDARQAGLRYGGYVGDAGPVVTADGSVATRLYGLTESGMKPSLLFRVASKETDWQVVTKPLAFTPLFYCPKQPDDLLRAAAEAAAVGTGWAELQPHLPPMFLETPTK